MSGAKADPAAWVLNVCLIENGYVPPFRDVKVSASDFEGRDETEKACRDFLPPIRLNASQQRVHDCLRAIGIVYFPRVRTDRRLTADEARRVVACAPQESGSGEFMGCMIRLGAGLPLQLDDEAQRAASAACGHLVPPHVADRPSSPATPPSPSTPYAALIDCLTKKGYEPAVGTPARGPTPLPEFRAAVEACRAHLPDNSHMGPEFARYDNCRIEQGTLPYPYFNFDASNRETAARVCAGQFPFPRTQAPDSTQKYLDCLRVNGVEIDAATLASDTPVELSVDRATAAARAYRETDPVRSNVRPENRPFYDCLANNGVLSTITGARGANPAVRRKAEVACAAHYPLAPTPDGHDEYVDCLRQRGVVARLGVRPDFERARRALAACEPLYPPRS